MAIFTYKIQEGVFCTTDVAPLEWLEKYPITIEEEDIIKNGAILETVGGILTISDDTGIIGISEIIE